MNRNIVGCGRRRGLCGSNVTERSSLTEKCLKVGREMRVPYISRSLISVYILDPSPSLLVLSHSFEMLDFRRNCCFSTVVVVLAFLAPYADAAPQMRWVTNPQLQMGVLPAEVHTRYTGNRNYGRPSVRSDFYRDYLYNPDTSYFKYPFFHADWSPTNYINAQWTSSTTVRPYAYGGSAGETASAPTEAESDSESPSRVAPSVRGTRTVPDPPYPSDYYYSYYPTTTERSPNGRPQPNYNYKYGNGNWNSQTAAPSRPQVIDDYWNTPTPTTALVRTTTTEDTLRGVWYAGSTSTTATKRIPSESQVRRDWETVPTTTTAAHEYSWWNNERTTTTSSRPTPEPTTTRYTTPYTTTTTTTTTTTPRTTTTNFETEDEIKAEAEAEVEDSGPRDENEDDDSDEDDDDDEEEWELDF